MEKLTQFDIIKNILQRTFAVAEPGWQEMIIDYFIEETRSSILKSYLISDNGDVKEKPLGRVSDLDVWMRRLQMALAQSGKPSFTRCKIHVLSNGTYQAEYGYERVNWDSLLDPDWNFFPTMKKKYLFTER